MEAPRQTKNIPIKPRNENWLSRFRRVSARAADRRHDPTFGPVFVRGKGARLWDVEGNDYIDLTCGYSASNFGHAYEPLVSVAEQQLRQLTHLTGDLHVGRVTLAERLVEVCRFPSQSSKVVFNATGARAVETAWKAAVSFRAGRLLSLRPGFHGRSIATAVLSDTAEISEPLIDREQFQVWSDRDYPYCAVCPLGLSYPSCSVRCADRLLEYIRTNSHQLSAVVVEPALGARGYVFPPAEFFRRLRAVTRDAGVLLIADEIQTGLGRTGDWLCSQADGWQADLVVLGKSLGGGMTPIAATIGRSDVLDSIPPGAESETFAATPFACAIALEVLRQLEVAGGMARGVEIGHAIRSSLKARFSDSRLHAALVRIEGVGACCVAEFADASGQAEHDRQSLARLFTEACMRQRLLVHFSGPLKTRVVLLPPLTMTDEELETVRWRLGQSVAEFQQAVSASRTGS